MCKYYCWVCILAGVGRSWCLYIYTLSRNSLLDDGIIHALKSHTWNLSGIIINLLLLSFHVIACPDCKRCLYLMSAHLGVPLYAQVMECLLSTNSKLPPPPPHTHTHSPIHAPWRSQSACGCRGCGFSGFRGCYAPRRTSRGGFRGYMGPRLPYIGLLYELQNCHVNILISLCFVFVYCHLCFTNNINVENKCVKINQWVNTSASPSVVSLLDKKCTFVFRN